MDIVWNFAQHLTSTNSKSLVLSGFINRLLAQHQAGILRRSSVSYPTTMSMSFTGNEIYNFESSTYDSSEQMFGTKGRSFM